MKIVCLFIIMMISVNYAQTNVTLLSHITPSSGIRYSDIWGYSDNNGNEFALLGAETGTYIINITVPETPVISAFIPGPNSGWRELKTHSHYAYVVTEGFGTDQGLQIIDLSQLPDTAVLANTYTAEFVTAHNIYIDNGYAYVVGTVNGGGMHILDLSDPVNPLHMSYYIQSEYVHDVYVWNDTVVASAADSYDLIDVKNKNNPFKISESAELPGIYAHSGWMTEDKRYFVATEENNTRDITVWDLQDRNSWNLVVPTWQTPSNATVHNLYIKGIYAHTSYYQDGYVVLDVSDPLNLKIAGQYDTENAWGCYPFFPSGLTVISDIQTGLYVFRFNSAVGIGNDLKELTFSLEQNYPNPFNPSTRLKYYVPESGYVVLRVYDVLGKKTSTIVNEYKTAGSYELTYNASGLPSGIYFAKLESAGNSQTIKMILMK